MDWIYATQTAAYATIIILSVCMYVCLSVCLLVRPSVCLSVPVAYAWTVNPFKVQWHQMVTFKIVQCHPDLPYIFNF